jgi:hypothetical protein
LNNCTYTASIEDISNQNILIYPNPANNSISIELPMSTESPIRIIDLSGNLIKEFETNQVFFQTDISNISSGVYLIKFDFQGSQVVKRIIVQK